MLEKRFQSMYFVFLVAVFTLATSLTYVVLNMFLDTVLDDHSYSTSCAVGFSGNFVVLHFDYSSFSSKGNVI